MGENSQFDIYTQIEELVDDFVEHMFGKDKEELNAEDNIVSNSYEVVQLIHKTVEDNGFWKLSPRGYGYVILHNEENKELFDVLAEALEKIRTAMNGRFEYIIRNTKCLISSGYETGTMSISWVIDNALDMEVLAWEEM